MPLLAERERIVRGQAAGMRWEMAMRRPGADLQPYVLGLEGYVEEASAPVRRREFSGTRVVVILEFEPRLRLYERGSASFSCHAGGFVVGLDDTFTLTEHLGAQAGVQLNLHPLGARRLFGLPMRELRDGAVSFRDVVPGERDLSAELADLGSWHARFDRVERFLRRRLADAAPEDAVVAWALDRIGAADGALSLEGLAAESGYSHKHLIARFHDQIGVTPKLWAQLSRFERLRKELTRPSLRSWAELARACGYYDQAHLARDVRRFTGGPPTALLRPEPAFLVPDR